MCISYIIISSSEQLCCQLRANMLESIIHHSYHDPSYTDHQRTDSVHILWIINKDHIILLLKIAMSIHVVSNKQKNGVTIIDHICYGPLYIKHHWTVSIWLLWMIEIQHTKPDMFLLCLIIFSIIFAIITFIMFKKQVL